MRLNNTETSQLVIPIAGAGNVGREIISTAALHMHPLIHALGNVAGRQVTRPIVPVNFGIGDLERTADNVRKHIHEQMDRYPNARVVIVGHSLGGLAAAYAAFSYPERIEGVVTSGAPMDGIRSWIPPYFRHKYGEFADQVREMQGVDSPPVTSLASRIDELVRVPSAHGLQHAEHVITGWQTHNMLVTTSGPVRSTTQAVEALFSHQPMAQLHLAETA